MIQDLTISIVQASLTWENKKANLDYFTGQINALGKTNLIVLPEMFSTGFSMNTGLAESMDDETVAWMNQTAREKQAAICGSVMIKEAGNYYNRFLFVTPEGIIHQYDKRHLFTMAGEQTHYSKGNNRLIVSYRGWNIFPLVCYDLRFPVWSRNRIFESKAEYDLLLYVANWPQKRSYAWKSLLKARAIENLSYVAGVNRVGVDGNDITYSGDSVVLDFMGKDIASVNGDQSATISLKHNELEEFRASFKALDDADDFTIRK